MEHTKPGKYDLFDTVVFSKDTNTWKFEITSYGLKTLEGDVDLLSRITGISSIFSASIDKIFIALNPEFALIKEIVDKIYELNGKKTSYENLLEVI